MADEFDDVEHATQTTAVFSSPLDSTMKDESWSRKREKSRLSLKKNLDRNFDAAVRMLKKRYFAEVPLYDDKMFHCSFFLSSAAFEKCFRPVVY